MTEPNIDADPADCSDQTPARLVAGALAHLATHMSSGCQRSAYLASMLLSRIAADPDTDDHLRRHARQLVDILDCEDTHSNGVQTRRDERQACAL